MCIRDRPHPVSSYSTYFLFTYITISYLLLLFIIQSYIINNCISHLLNWELVKLCYIVPQYDLSTIVQQNLGKSFYMPHIYIYIVIKTKFCLLLPAPTFIARLVKFSLSTFTFATLVVNGRSFTAYYCNRCV